MNSRIQEGDLTWWVSRMSFHIPFDTSFFPSFLVFYSSFNINILNFNLLTRFFGILLNEIHKPNSVKKNWFTYFE
ncbi:unnamed protein product [Rhizophagus irregularis]|nr:unnamed protein product [Rhizophagus irregularis]CAB5360135.1 unnamed protein product [Rhizophagus irregularis]